MSKRKQKVKSLGRNKTWALVGDYSSKYFNWTPSIATIYKGHIWPIGISIKWLWFGGSITYLGKD